MVDAGRTSCHLQGNPFPSTGEEFVIFLLSGLVFRSMRWQSLDFVRERFLTTLFPIVIQEAAEAGVRLLSLPECFSFIGAKQGESLIIAEPMTGPIMRRYQSLARHVPLSRWGLHKCLVSHREVSCAEWSFWTCNEIGCHGCFSVSEGDNYQPLANICDSSLERRILLFFAGEVQWIMPKVAFS